MYSISKRKAIIHPPTIKIGFKHSAIIVQLQQMFYKSKRLCCTKRKGEAIWRSALLLFLFPKPLRLSESVYAHTQTMLVPKLLFGYALVKEALLRFLHAISSIPDLQFPVLLLHQEYLKRQNCISNTEAIRQVIFSKELGQE